MYLAGAMPIAAAQANASANNGAYGAQMAGIAANAYIQRKRIQAEQDQLAQQLGFNSSQADLSRAFQAQQAQADREARANQLAQEIGLRTRDQDIHSNEFNSNLGLQQAQMAQSGNQFASNLGLKRDEMAQSKDQFGQQLDLQRSNAENQFDLGQQRFGLDQQQADWQHEDRENDPNRFMGKLKMNLLKGLMPQATPGGESPNPYQVPGGLEAPPDTPAAPGMPIATSYAGGQSQAGASGDDVMDSMKSYMRGRLTPEQNAINDAGNAAGGLGTSGGYVLPQTGFNNPVVAQLFGVKTQQQLDHEAKMQGFQEDLLRKQVTGEPGQFQKDDLARSEQAQALQELQNGVEAYKAKGADPDTAAATALKFVNAKHLGSRYFKPLTASDLDLIAPTPKDVSPAGINAAAMAASGKNSGDLLSAIEDELAAKHNAALNTAPLSFNQVDKAIGAPTANNAVADVNFKPLLKYADSPLWWLTPIGGANYLRKKLLGSAEDDVRAVLPQGMQTIPQAGPGLEDRLNWRAKYDSQLPLQQALQTKYGLSPEQAKKLLLQQE